jgi:hypothetical protein
MELDNINELPENWCVRMATKEISDYFSDNGYCNIKLFFINDSIYTSAYVTSYKVYRTAFPTGYTEISFEDFIKYVVNKGISSIEVNYNCVNEILKKYNIV